MSSENDAYTRVLIRRAAPPITHGGPLPPVTDPTRPCIPHFGDPARAWLFTVGINPSGGEHSKRRNFPALAPGNDWSSAPDELVERAWRVCRDYFTKHHPHPWFGPYAALLHSIRASYHDGSAAHLDLCTFATTVPWRAVHERQRAALLDIDAETLKTQICRSRVEVVLAGSTHAIELLGNQNRLGLAGLGRITASSSLCPEVRIGLLHTADRTVTVILTSAALPTLRPYPGYTHDIMLGLRRLIVAAHDHPAQLHTLLAHQDHRTLARLFPQFAA